MNNNNSFTPFDRTWYARTILALSEVPSDPLRSAERYAGKVLLTDIQGQRIQFIQKRWFPKATAEDPVIVIDSKYEYRPDIISVDYYNSPLYAWAILAANGMRSIWQLQNGVRIKIPNLATVTGGLQ